MSAKKTVRKSAAKKKPLNRSKIAKAGWATRRANAVAATFTTVA